MMPTNIKTNPHTTKSSTLGLGFSLGFNLHMIFMAIDIIIMPMIVITTPINTHAKIGVMRSDPYPA